ncbi:uncharacterized protein LOC118423113 isoform X3 [Branchiostoma floridae]|uniref:Uncharacterized protein LOC118423113 isoform X3 n=1 Tax=Branchiostoma floridae TaxID=7739 RepID=A0A9J7N1M4_BRAFL|nr:uncharacterized protein LOC118423113 isoform X3 [Branchiostoma floridae]
MSWQLTALVWQGRSDHAVCNLELSTVPENWERSAAMWLHCCSQWRPPGLFRKNGRHAPAERPCGTNITKIRLIHKGLRTWTFRTLNMESRSRRRAGSRSVMCHHSVKKRPLLLSHN